MRKIIFVDFDHTLYRGDSMLDFALFCNGSIGMARKLARLPFRVKALRGCSKKEWFLNLFIESDVLVSQGDAFYGSFGKSRVNSTLVYKLERLVQAGWQMVIVTASAYEWVHPFARALGAELIATRLTVSGELLRMDGRNCKGEEKVRRIDQEMALEPGDRVMVFGNRGEDDAMGSLATDGYCSVKVGRVLV